MDKTPATSRRSSRPWPKRFGRVTLSLTTPKTATANAMNSASRPHALTYRSAQVEQATLRPRNNARSRLCLISRLLILVFFFNLFSFRSATALAGGRREIAAIDAHRYRPEPPSRLSLVG